MDPALEPEAVAELFLDVPFLEPLSPGQRMQLAEEATIRTFTPGAEIVVEGTFGHTFYLIESGTVLVYKVLDDEVIELARRRAGTFFGEMALIQDQPRSATVQAETDVTAIEISRRGFETLLTDNPDITFAVLRELSRRLRDSDRKMIEHLLQKNEELKQARSKLEESYDATLVALSNALDLHDTVTEGHSIRVASIALKIGEELGLSEHELQSLRHGALLHDIGKIGVPGSILQKRGALTQQEWQIMYQHPTWGAKMLEHIDFLQDALKVVRYHHESWDGSGYPEGLRGPEIPLLARIFTVADAYDAITRERPYKSARPPEEALTYIRKQAGQRYDPGVVEAFEAVFPEVRDSL